MTATQRENLWFLINDVLENVDKQDAEYVAEQWQAEIEYPRHTHRPQICKL